MAFFMRKHMTEVKPPTPLGIYSYSIFLAGSIAQGKAGDWQKETTQKFTDLDLFVLNPRRDDWDSSWKQHKDFPPFREQVTWELDAQQMANHILMYFDPETKAPISLLELGLFAATGKLTVCCPEGFWRKGNVDLVCERHNIPQVPDLSALAEAGRQQFLRTFLA